ncbi:enhancin-like peptidase M60 family [Chitinophaga niastensis]|uniref:Enhancin-like peptidase M60 family n=1 Tax=Chitinophaga niastensis TaxID=536980 RepID=A0A2P8HJ47_CHINA|nr:M60 family metallopeptidase [Chitinophaga niastensis]PSL46247.1 enhancin-like peptidase M60 family [Chitinophaga niastensis]
MKISAIRSVVGLSLLVTLLAACKKDYNFKDGYDTPAAIDTVGVGGIDTSMFKIDSSGFPDARKFPGLVSVVEPRLNNVTVTVDLDYKKVSPLIRISVPPGNWMSTGYYAAPGELVKIDVPAGMEGLAIQIGSHTDNVNGKLPQLRAGIITTQKVILPGVNYIRNIYGGLIYLIPPGPAKRKLTVTLSNVCKSPDFVLGESTDAAWKDQVRHSQVPVLELRGKRFIMTLYRKVLLGMLDNFSADAVVKKWDEVVEKDYHEWYGLSDNPADPIDQAPGTPHRFVLDIQISLGSGHNGYPCMAYLDWHSDFLDTAMINQGASWGPFHELGHNFQMNDMWSWSGADGLGETSNNLFVFQVAQRHGVKPPRIYDAGQDFVQPALDWAATSGTSKRFSSVTDVFQRLVPFVQLFQRYGYGMMGYICKEGRHEPRASYINEVKKNFFFVKASNYAGVNLKPFFDHWGIVVSPSAVAEVSQLPLLTEQVWTNDIR